MKPGEPEIRDGSGGLRWGLAGAVLAALALAVSRRFTAALLLAGSAHAFFCTVAAIPNHRFSGPLARRFRPRSREVWLTLDDGPDPGSTPAILKVLREHGAKATFFLIGTKAARHPELVRAIVREGHSLGNHTHGHPAASFWAAGPGRIAREIDGANRAIVAAGPAAPRFFRPPVGMANLFVAPALRSRGMFRVGWSARGFDTRPQDADVMINTIMRHCVPGTIILFHEIGATAGAVPLDRLLSRLRRERLTCELPPEEAFQ